MSETVKLKPCRNCKSRNIHRFDCGYATVDYLWHGVVCHNCGYQCENQRTEEEATKAWNTRKPIDKENDKLRALVSECKVALQVISPYVYHVMDKRDGCRESLWEALQDHIAEIDYNILTTVLNRISDYEGGK